MVELWVAIDYSIDYYDCKPSKMILGLEMSRDDRPVFMTPCEHDEYMRVCKEYQKWQEKLKELINCGLARRYTSLIS